ncbi:MAG: HepT-like ribonuclease domain-containing protein [Chromatiales bacterium]
MSDTALGACEWRFYLDDMIAFTQKVQSYTDGLDQAGFIADGLTYDATLRNLELIGEAATHIPDEVRAAHPEIPWRMIIATRNRLNHAYLGIDDDTLWSIIQDDIASLLMSLQKLKQSQQ